MLKQYHRSLVLGLLLIYCICVKPLFNNLDLFCKNIYILGCCSTLYACIVLIIGERRHKRLYQILEAGIVGFFAVISLFFSMFFYIAITMYIIKEFGGEFISNVWMQYIYPIFF